MTEGEDSTLSLAPYALDLVKAVCQVIVGDLWEEVHAEFKFLREDVTMLHFNTAIGNDHMSVRLVSLESTMPFAVVTGEVA